MPRLRTEIPSGDMNYWVGKLDGFYTRAREATQPPSAQLSKRDRQFWTRQKGLPAGGLLKNDKESMQILIEQAMLTLEAAGFDDDETQWLEDCLKKSSTKGEGGQAPIPLIDKIAIYHFFPRMTGCDKDTASDMPHQLNTVQAKKLLRERLGMTQNTLGKILKSK